MTPLGSALGMTLGAAGLDVDRADADWDALVLTEGAALDEEMPHFPNPLWQPVPQWPSVFPQKPYWEQHSP